MRFLLSILLSLVAVSVLAERTEIQSDDFAYGLPIHTQEEAAVYRIVVPESVYKKLTHANFSDLRVFNAAGEVVPYSLRRQVVQDKKSPEQFTDVPFFPYEMLNIGSNVPLSVRVTTNEHGAVVSVGGAVTAERRQRVSSYLVDISSLDEGPNGLLLDWETDEPSFVAHLRVEGSNDFASWRTLVQRQSLVRLHFSNRELERNRIELPKHRYKYLRVIWPSNHASSRLTNVKAYFAGQVEPIQRNWVELHGIQKDESKPVFEYQTTGYLPVDRADVALSESNTLVEVILSSRSSDAANWRRCYNGDFYRLQVDGITLSSDPVSVPVSSDSFWKLTARSDLSGIGQRTPVLRLGYVPHELYFLARGAGPYLMGFGAHAIDTPQAKVDFLLDKINAGESDVFIADAQVGELQALGGEARLKAEPPPFPWKRVILWSVLVLGVFVLGWMAWRLGTQMNRTKEQSEE